MRRAALLLTLLLAGVAHAQTGPAPAFPHADGTDCDPGEAARGTDEEGNAELCFVAGGGLDVQEGGVSAVDPTTALNLDGDDFDVTDEGSGVAGVALAGSLLGSDLTSSAQEILTDDAGGEIHLSRTDTAGGNPETIILDLFAGAHNKGRLYSDSDFNTLLIEGINIFSDSQISAGRVSLKSSSSTYTSNAATTGKSVFMAYNGDMEINLYAGGWGYGFCVHDMVAIGTMLIDPPASDKIWFPGIASAVDDRFMSWDGCTDIYDTGSPVQTSCAGGDPCPDTLCDGDDSITATAIGGNFLCYTMASDGINSFVSSWGGVWTNVGP